MKEQVTYILRTFCFIILAVVFVACSKQDENMTTSASAQYETLRRDVAAMLSEEPDSAFVVLDSIEATNQYPDCVINLRSHNGVHCCGTVGDSHPSSQLSTAKCTFTGDSFQNHTAKVRIIFEYTYNLSGKSFIFFHRASTPSSHSPYGDGS